MKEVPQLLKLLGFDLDGVTLPRSPEWTISLFGQYDFTIRDKPAWVQAEWSYPDETTSDIEAVVSGLPILDNAVTEERGLDTSFNGNGLGEFRVPPHFRVAGIKVRLFSE